MYSFLPLGVTTSKYTPPLVVFRKLVSCSTVSQGFWLITVITSPSVIPADFNFPGSSDLTFTPYATYVAYGVKVKSLEPGKLKSAGITEGDVITVINQKPCETVEQLTNFLNTTKGGVYLEVVTPSGKKEYIAFGI